MTDAVGIIASTQGNVGASVAPVAPAPAATTAASATSAPTPVAGLLQNPKVVLDPTAGFITEYLSANGSEVIAQTPSAITVAYLRLGLTADGLSKQSTQTATA
jgi:hypothetical protein